MILGYILHLGEIIALDKSYISGSEKRRKRQSNEQRLSGSKGKAEIFPLGWSCDQIVMALVRVRARVRFDHPRTEGPANAMSCLIDASSSIISVLAYCGDLRLIQGMCCLEYIFH